jgi:hypothetical protein
VKISIELAWDCTNKCIIAVIAIGKLVAVTDIISTCNRHFGFPSACSKSFETYHLKTYLHNREPIKENELCSLTCVLSARAVTEFLSIIFY